MSIHYIKSSAHHSANKGCMTSSNFIKQVYDHFADMSYEYSDKDGKSTRGYNKLYKYIYEHKMNNSNDIIVTIGGDHSLSSATINAINDASDNLYVLVFDASPNLHNMSTINQNYANRMVFSSILGLMESFVQAKKIMATNKIIYIGLRDIDDIEQQFLDELGILYFTLNKIRILGIDKIAIIIKDIIKDNSVHVSISMKVFDNELCKSVSVNHSDGFNIKEMEEITKLLKDIKKNKSFSLDIVELDANVGSDRDVKNTAQIARQCLINILELKEKSINIFNEESEFLIYRPLEQVDTKNDTGWYIVRGLKLSERNDIMKNVPRDTIISIEIEDEDCLIAKTSISYQQEHPYYDNMSISEMVLFPQEKQHMLFELLNT